MKSDDRTKKGQEDREKLLEEIRRRAEEAELKRIEEEEQEHKISSSQRGPAGAAKQPPPQPPPKEPLRGKTAPQDESAKTQGGKVAGRAPAKPGESGTRPAAPGTPPSTTAPVRPPAVPPGAGEARGLTKEPTTKVPDVRPVRPEQPPSQKVPPSGRAKTDGGFPPPVVEPPASVPFPAPFPIPSGETPVASSKAAREQRITVLRERLVIALDRGKIQKASDLLADLSSLIDDQKELQEYRDRLHEVQSRKEAGKIKKPSPPAPPPSTVKPKVPPPEDRAQRESRKKRIAELLDTADSLYQAEKYERGLQTVNEILELDPENEEAPRMKAAIEKAQELALRIQQEETRRKAEEAANYTAPAVEAPKVTKGDKDVWGTSTAPTVDLGYELPPEEKGPVGPPKPPAIEQFFEHVSKIKVPVRSVVIVSVILAIGIVGYFLYDSVRNTATPAKYSLLIFPATPLATDTEFVWIADGITEDLIRDFATVNELRVISAATALGFRNSAAGAVQVARSVGANYYLQWSILRAPEGIVVQPSFFDTSSARPLWVSRYQTSMRELPAVRLELLHQMATVMNVTIGAEEETAFRRAQIPTPEAYDHYLRARYMLRRHNRFVPGDAIRELELATQTDTTFSDAYSALGWAHILAFEKGPVAAAMHLAQASVCVQQAISLGARNAEAFRVWGLIEEYRSRDEGAVERLQQAVGISPADAESQRRLAVVNVLRNNTDAALKAALRAVADDPGNVDSYSTLGMVQQFRADYPAARRAYEQGLRYASDRSDYAGGFYADVLVYLQLPERAIDLLNDHLARVRENPMDYYKLGRINQSAGKPKGEWQGELTKSKTLLQQQLAAEPSNAEALSLLALVHTRLGEFKDALSANARAQRLSPDNLTVLFNTARMYALQRDKAHALEFLTKAIRLRESLPEILDMDFFNLHSEPDFITAITR